MFPFRDTDRPQSNRAALHRAFRAGVSAMVLVLANGQRADARALNGGGSGTATPATVNAAAASIAAAQQAAAAAQRSRDSLSRANQAIQAIRDVQGAAAAAARSAAGGVPNGLGVGALKPVENPLLSSVDQTGMRTWDGASSPSQSIGADGKIDVTIRQTQSNAILSWDSFHVGRDTRLTFDQQGNANWIALNRVVGNDAAPSHILGSIKSDGTVLVVNRNGIVFGGSAQINVGSLMASSLEIGTPTVTLNGANVPTTIAQRNQTFLQYGLLGYADSGARVDAYTFSGLTGDTRQGTVNIAKGASISTSRDDGLLLFMAPQVVNSGYLSAPKGQVALASGDKIMLTRATGAADSNNPSVRGVLADSRSAETGDRDYVWNTSEGLISAPQGNITLIAGSNSSKQINTGGVVGTFLVPGGAP